MKKQDINIGDKLLCKNDYNSNNITTFYENVEYEISNIILSDNIISKEKDYRCIYIKNDIDNDVFFVGQSDLDILFYTKNEVRKIKLKKLDNIFN